MNKILIKIVFIFCINFLVIGCNGQNKNNKINKKNMEKFNFEIYKETDYGIEKYIKKDGTEILMIGFNEKKGGFINEKPAKPSFHTFYKEFYPNGNIRKKEKYIGKYVKIDISEHYDENFNLVKEINEDEKFGKVKPNDILLFLEKEGYINVKTGQGRENTDGSPKFELGYEDNIWFITISQGRGITPTDLEGVDLIGEPSEWFPYTYEIDGNTAKVLKTNKK